MANPWFWFLMWKISSSGLKSDVSLKKLILKEKLTTFEINQVLKRFQCIFQSWTGGEFKGTVVNQTYETLSL